MNHYTIYCTESQTKKALELGAPIELDGWEDRPYVYINGAYLIPTAEQMISWLEDQDGIKLMSIECAAAWYYTVWLTDSISPIVKGHYTSRKEVTLAAIDAALDFLTNNKK